MQRVEIGDVLRVDVLDIGYLRGTIKGAARELGNLVHRGSVHALTERMAPGSSVMSCAAAFTGSSASRMANSPTIAHGFVARICTPSRTIVAAASGAVGFL